MNFDQWILGTAHFQTNPLELRHLLSELSLSSGALRDTRLHIPPWLQKKNGSNPVPLGEILAVVQLPGAGSWAPNDVLQWHIFKRWELGIGSLTAPKGLSQNSIVNKSVHPIDGYFSQSINQSINQSYQIQNRSNQNQIKSSHPASHLKPWLKHVYVHTHIWGFPKIGVP